MVDGELLLRHWKAARNGDLAALDAMTRLLEPMVQGVVRCRLRRLGSPPDLVEDIGQDVLFKLSLGYRRCRASSTPQILAWVHIIARRCVVDVLRSSSAPLRFGAVLLDDARLEAAWIQEADLSPSDPAIARLCEFAVEAQQALSLHATQLLWQRLIEGTALRDLGTQYGVPEGAIKRRIQRAIAALRRRVRARVDELPDPEREQLAPLLQRWEA
jgi:RNA polymerase sigma factor (sigma-70 family)